MDQISFTNPYHIPPMEDDNPAPPFDHQQWLHHYHHTDPQFLPNFPHLHPNFKELPEPPSAAADDDDPDEEELGAMKEMMFKIAAMQPVDIDPTTIRKPRRRNVRISDDPQSVAARHRRERISEKIRILQRLVPGGTKMDTASMLDEAIRYVKFLKRQIRLLQGDPPPPCIGVSAAPPPPEDWTAVANPPSPYLFPGNSRPYELL